MTAAPRNLHQLFESQVVRTPDAVAVTCRGDTLTYGQLNARANDVSRRLRRLGVGLDTPVAICTERSVHMVVGLLGILKAGGAYVPLDPDYPRRRLAFMLEDCGAPVLVTQQTLSATLPHFDGALVHLDATPQAIHAEGCADEPVTLNGDNLAYIIYTSGSSGQPKGVAIRHESLVSFLTAIRNLLGFTRRDVMLALTTMSFDVAALEIWLPLLVGACICVVPRDLARDGAGLARTMVAEGVTVLHATPSGWRLLLDSGWQGSARLTILTGGEPCPASLAEELLVQGRSIWNLYGPTETTICATACRLVSARPPISIGRPLANTQVHVLDPQLHPIPQGEVGELFIGGAGVAKGYVNLPELTAAKFIPDPFSNNPAGRLYKSGDSVRLLPDGNLEFLGRIDDQVKIRGIRIEPGEIERVLVEHPAVRQAVVMARGDDASGKHLITYIVPDDGERVSTSELRAFLTERLPREMVPAVFQQLGSLPMTPSGKLDRHALPVPAEQPSGSDRQLVSARTETERRVAEIWRSLLHTERVGIHDDFFELGGHSLLVTQLASRVRQQFNITVPLACLFEKTTVAEQAVAITQYQAEEVEDSTLLRYLAELEGLPPAKTRAQP